MTSIHIPTAISTTFSTPFNQLVVLMGRNVVVPGYKVLSDLIIADGYMHDDVVIDEWELMYKRNAKWGIVHTPLIDEHLDVYKLFFKYDINSSTCPITDLSLTYFLKSMYTTTYTRWCIAICRNLYTLMSNTSTSIGMDTTRGICKDILSYMKDTIYTESKYHLDEYFNNRAHMSKFKTRIYEKRRRLPGGYQ